MLFVFVMPQAIGGFGNMLLPLVLGSSELVLPRLNGLSLYVLVLGVCLFSLGQVGLFGIGTSSG
jgi:cytochrome c oxidase subunit 1